jgi:multidrug efflux pump subunit AcrB
MISDFFIRRPVLANVLAILMMVIGIVALFALPVAQYPDVVPPTVQVTTRRVIPAPAPAPSSMPSPCRSSSR